MERKSYKHNGMQVEMLECAMRKIHKLCPRYG